MIYSDFLNNKRIEIRSVGIDIASGQLNEKLFLFQRDITQWSLKKGRSAIFAGCGLGKTPMQLEWSHQIVKHTGGKILILAPLAVASQTVKEGREKFGISVNYARTQAEVLPGITITNYEMLHNFNPNEFIGICLDESSIIKSFSGAMRNEIISLFAKTPYKLACTATPSPNDYMELGNHAEFLGVMTRAEMLSMFFVHDGGDTQKWRLKGHAISKFWDWVASWAVMIQKPSDLGYDDAGFELPPLNIHQITIKSSMVNQTGLFVTEAQTLQERQKARRDTITERANKCAEIVNPRNEPWVIWCNLNDESEELTKTIYDAIEIRGSHSPEYKEQKMISFVDGNVRILVTKPSIAGFGMNWQHCSKIVFVGLSDSFEEYYQAVRRCWRFGQKNPVDVYVITADIEGSIVANIKRKEADFEKMLSGMIAATQEITRQNIKSTFRNIADYKPKHEMIIPKWLKEDAA